jgi:FAD/FMN-containing dehydrogenase
MADETVTPVDRTVVDGFREAFRGRITLPGDPWYDAARVVWNAMIDRRPAMVATCTGVDDVVAAIRFGREHELPIAVRGGGHSVGGFSTCDGGIVLDLSGMRGVRVDAEARTARADGGTLLGDLDRAAQEVGMAVPVGVVGHTGVGGLTLGGGMGRLQRKHGFSIDNLLGVELVTGDGRVIWADENQERELFWGIRGAGPNFGVVTGFRFRMHPVGPDMTQGWVAHRIERAHDIATLFRDYAAAAPREVFLSLAFGLVGPDDPFPAELVGRPVVILGAAHSGSEEAAERELATVREPGALADTIARKTYLDMQTQGDEAMAWGKRFYSKGGFVDELSDELVDVAAAQAEAAPGECTVGFWAQGGAIADVPVDATAFNGRHAAFWVGAEASWEDPARDDQFVGWGRSAWDALTPFTAGGHYVNDLVESGEDLVRAAYGPAKYERLVAIKRAFDPDNVFRLNQNIRP